MKILNQYLVTYQNENSFLSECETADPLVPRFFVAYPKWTKNGWLNQVEEIDAATAANLITPPPPDDVPLP
jgi:hypothetical protein